MPKLIAIWDEGDELEMISEIQKLDPKNTTRSDLEKIFLKYPNVYKLHTVGKSWWQFWK